MKTSMSVFTRRNAMWQVIAVMFVLGFESVTAQTIAKPEVATIMYYYTGEFNNKPVEANASLFITPSTGQFNAVLNFNKIDKLFHPALVSISFLSVSCGNGAEELDGLSNILTLTNGNYASERTVTLTSESGKVLGEIEIKGTFTKVGPMAFRGDVKISGNYNGPIDFKEVNGYNLPVKPVSAKSLKGGFTAELETTSGMTISASHEHTYTFLNGTTKDLTPHVMQLTYDKVFWSPESKLVKFSGHSAIRAPDAMETASIKKY
jgi:hypothetical protein